MGEKTNVNSEWLNLKSALIDIVGLANGMLDNIDNSPKTEEITLMRGTLYRIANIADDGLDCTPEEMSKPVNIDWLKGSGFVKLNNDENDEKREMLERAVIILFKNGILDTDDYNALMEDLNNACR